MECHKKGGKLPTQTGFLKGECSKLNNCEEGEIVNEDLQCKDATPKENFEKASEEENKTESESFIDKENQNIQIKSGYFDCLQNYEEMEQTGVEVIKEFPMKEVNSQNKKSNLDQNYINLDEVNGIKMTYDTNCSKLKKQDTFEILQREDKEAEVEDEILSIEVHSVTDGKDLKDNHKKLKSNKKRRGRPTLTMQFNVLIWNIRGISNSLKRLRNLIHTHHISILLILEPIVEKSQVQEYGKKLGFDNCYANTNGKIWGLWKEEIEGHVTEDKEQHLTLKVKRQNKENYITAVYAKCSVLLRRNLWNDLTMFFENLESPWLIGGDFNSILNRGEKDGGNSPNRRSMEDFSNMLINCGVDEHIIRGSNYTWTNGRIWEKLDRILVNAQWLNVVNSFEAETLNRDTSDHCPFLLKCNVQQISMKSSFRFQAMWCQNDSLLDTFKK